MVFSTGTAPQEFRQMLNRVRQMSHVIVVDLPLLRVAVEGSDNPVFLEKPFQASIPPVVVCHDQVRCQIIQSP